MKLLRRYHERAMGRRSSYCAASERARKNNCIYSKTLQLQEPELFRAGEGHEKSESVKLEIGSYN